MSKEILRPQGKPAPAAQPEQKSVGKFAKFTNGIWREVTDGSAGVPLYTAPPQRTWVGLTDEDMGFLFPHGKSEWVQETVKIIEAKLRSKNT